MTNVLSPLIVAVDLDQVIVDFIGPITRYFNDRFNKNIKFTDYNGQTWDKIWGLPNTDKVNSIISDFMETEEASKMEPIPGAVDALRYLAITRNMKFIIVTARPEKFRSTTEAWIDKHFGNNIIGPSAISKIVFTNSHGQDPTHKAINKATACKALGCECLIDDLPINFSGATEVGLATILFNLDESYMWSKQLAVEYSKEIAFTATSWKYVSDLLIHLSYR